MKEWNFMLSPVEHAKRLMITIDPGVKALVKNKLILYVCLLYPSSLEFEVTSELQINTSVSF